jgi:uridine kinase
MPDAQAPIVLGVAGGTGSGKSTVAAKIVHAVGPNHIAYLDQDSYYRDLSNVTYEERRQRNFDHPDAIEFELLAQHIDRLRNGETVQKPRYSFTESVRLREHTSVPPAPVVIVEGILVLSVREVRERMDIKIYVDADDDIRLLRRLQRDINERGRAFDGIVAQYHKTVRPMHLTFVEPSKRYADLIIPRGGNNDIAINLVVATLRERCNVQPTVG